MPKLIKVNTTHKTLIRLGSTLKYSPKPPQTPAITLPFLDLYNFLTVIFTSFFITILMN